MNKLILSGVRNIPTEEIPKPNQDYSITLVGALKGIYTPESFDDSEQNEKSYYLHIERIDKIIEVNSGKEIVIEEKDKKPYTPSQKLRFAIMANLGEQDYETFMKFLMGKIDGLIEDYKDKQNDQRNNVSSL
jgi:hypothetical protein